MHDTPRIQPVGEHWEWQHSGLCRTRSPELFFHPDGERGAVKRAREARAVRLCGACPVIEQCREHALALPEPYGVWGGLTEQERADIVALDERRIS